MTGNLIPIKLLPREFGTGRTNSESIGLWSIYVYSLFYNLYFNMSISCMKLALKVLVRTENRIFIEPLLKAS